jgi:hypothetical protein
MAQTGGSTESAGGFGGGLFDGGLAKRVCIPSATCFIPSSTAGSFSFFEPGFVGGFGGGGGGGGKGLSGGGGGEGFWPASACSSYSQGICFKSRVPILHTLRRGCAEQYLSFKRIENSNLSQVMHASQHNSSIRYDQPTT